jgi:Fe2+ or Zn2+ uptake regulation protein
MSVPSQAVVRRETRQRRMIYDVVRSAKIHPTAEWVYERVRREMPRVSLGTVYRNLQLLVAEGRLRGWTRARMTRYDGDLKPHDHFVCESCGLLLDLERVRTPLPSEEGLRADGHVVTERILDFVGVCRDCRRTKRTGGRKGR